MTDDERIARLQRLAYGADTPDAVRARAIDELTGLVATGDVDRRDHEAGARASAPGAPDGADPDGAHDGRPEGTASDREPDGEARSRARRRTVLVGLGGLLIGVVVGAAISRAVPVESGSASDVAPRAPAFGSGEPGTPLDETLLPPLFDRLPPVADPGRIARAVQGIDPASLRLVATRTDGPAAYVARTDDGGDVCLVVSLPGAPVASRCTTGGRLPAGGLRIDHAVTSRISVVAILGSGGTVTLGFDTAR